jgi:hypothetical protein
MMWNLTVQSIHNACNGNLRLHGYRLVLGQPLWRFRRNRIEAALRILSNPSTCRIHSRLEGMDSLVSRA